MVYPITRLKSITSVIKDFKFFVVEKWEIASDYQGSHNTANIGSIVKISDVIEGNGVFKNLGEKWFDDYWMNYGKIRIRAKKGKYKKLTKIDEFLKYKGHGNTEVNPVIRPSRKKNE